MFQKKLKFTILTAAAAGTLLLGGCSSENTPTTESAGASAAVSLQEASGEAGTASSDTTAASNAGQTSDSTQASQPETEALRASYEISVNTEGLDETHAISDTLFGLFLEDINHAVDGGMYAELVKNRSFEYGNGAGNQTKHGWSPTGSDSEGFTFEVTDGSEDKSGLNDNNPHYAVLTNTTADYKGIYNKGYLEGMAVTVGADYSFSVYLKAPEGYDGDIRITLTDDNNTIYAQGTIEGITKEWQKYSLTLTPSLPEGSDSDSSILNKNLHLCVELTQGTIHADMISLLPVDTYKGTSIRKDFGEALEALNPTFLRFPGGCVIEGRDLESMYSWKDSIGNGMEFTINGETTTGDVAARPQGRSIWNGTKGHPYYTTYGLGFYEYFELCEILDCMPIPILNAGMTCQIQSSKYMVYDTDSEEFQQCVQDALDLVEFCLGDTSTYWGGVRAAMGHEEPFELKYIGIGNEQWQSEYFKHYQKFVEAFNAAAKENPELYGDIELIVANGPSSGDRVGWNYVENNPEDTRTGLVDEHYYEPPSFFFTNTNRYDSYDRDLQAKVFLGEYASQSNTLESALSEAAYMTGLEKNGDVVELACYAPLFGNRTQSQWTPDLIWFDNNTVYGSVNYYVQQMYSNNVGVTSLDGNLALQGNAESSALSGKVGLGTWQTSAAYDNLTITDNTTGEVLYSCTFDSEDVLKADGWEEHEGEWSIQDGRLVQSYTDAPMDGNTGDAIYIGDTSWTNYTLTVEAEILSGMEGFLIPVCVENTANNVFWNLGGWGNTVSCLQIVSGGSKSGQVSGTVKSAKLNHNQVYEIKVVVEGSNIQCYLNDMKYVDYTYEAPQALYESTSVAENGDLIMKFVNTTDAVLPIAASLKDFNAADYEASAQVTVLAGDALSDVNSFEVPDNIVPMEATLEIGTDFTYEAPAYSFSVIRIPHK